MNRIRNWVYIALAMCLPGCGGVGPGVTDFTAYLPYGYFLFQSSAYEIVIAPCNNWNDKTEVPTMVVSLGFDDHFILAKQQLMDAKQRNPVSNKYQYWIINAVTKERHGPFTEVEFTAKRKELSVPDRIELRSKDSFRPR